MSSLVEVTSTDKKNDDEATSTPSTQQYRWNLTKKICKSYVLYPLVLIFAIIGMFSVAEDLGTIAAGKREEANEKGVSAGSSTAMETTNPNNLKFDGHIRTDQTKGHGMFQEITGRKTPFGDAGESMIFRLLRNAANVDSVYDKEDIPFYWEIGFTGHTSIESKLCECLNVDIASSAGSNDAGKLDILEPLVPAAEGTLCKVFNVDLGSHKGIQRSKELGLIDKIQPDFVSSPFLPEIASLFTENHKGRLITSIPVTSARVYSSYQHLHNEGMFDGTYLEFVSSDHILANNYLVHMLSGKWGGVQELTEDDLLAAHRVLKEKFTIFRWSDSQAMAEFLLKNEHWGDANMDPMQCMFPPKEVEEDKKILIKRQHTPNEKTPEQLAIEEALSLHNKWDRALYERLKDEGFV